MIEIEEDRLSNNGQEEMPLGNLEKGFIDIANCGITLPTNQQNRKFTFRICSQQKSLELTVSTEDESSFHDWLYKIKEVQEAVDNKV